MIRSGRRQTISCCSLARRDEAVARMTETGGGGTGAGAGQELTAGGGGVAVDLAVEIKETGTGTDIVTGAEVTQDIADAAKKEANLEPGGAEEVEVEADIAVGASLLIERREAAEVSRVRGRRRGSKQTREEEEAASPVREQAAPASSAISSKAAGAGLGLVRELRMRSLTNMVTKL